MYIARFENNTEHLNSKSSIIFYFISYLIWDLISKPAVHTQRARHEDVYSESLRNIRVISPALPSEICIYISSYSATDTAFCNPISEYLDGQLALNIQIVTLQEK
jgi:hypothetical protein